MGHDRDDDDRRYGRKYDRDADMGGSHWSGASGRGGMMGRPPWADGRSFAGNDFDRSGGSRGSDMGFASPYHQQAEHEQRERERERGPHYGKGPKGYKRSDARILDDVCEAIADQGHIDASDVEVKVEEGVVILTGTVGLRHQKRALEMLVENCRGVDEVRNELRLRRERDRNEADRATPAAEAPRSNGRAGAPSSRS